MAMDNDLREMLQQTVNVALVSSRDEFNQRAFGSDVAYPARVAEVFTNVVDFNGKEVLATTVVWIGPESSGETLPTTMDVHSRLTLPDGSTPTLLSVTELPDETGNPHHIKIFLGRSNQ